MTMIARITAPCDRTGHAARRLLTAAFLLLTVTVPARADWTVAAYMGASFTRPSTLTITQGSGSREARGVHFDGRPFASPPYYGYRAGWRSREAFGIDVELIHLKVYAHAADLPPNVERFSMSHGLNLLLGNVTWRPAPQGRVQLEARAGAGVAIPHGESEIDGVAQEQYEVSSLALQGAAAIRLRLARQLGAFGEYKLTTAAPTVSVAGGRINGRYTSHHVAVGLEWVFSKRQD
jgi:lipid A oxidase